jgi:hypothetical protein
MKIAIESTTIGPKFTGTNRFLNCLIEQLTILDNDILNFNPIFHSPSHNRQRFQTIVKRLRL